MLALAVVLLVMIFAAASILIALPEALETAATPAFGAPWITAGPGPTAPKQDATPRAPTELSARLP